MADKKTFREYFFWNKDHSGWLMNNLLFFVFIGFLGLLYIGNSHYAEKQIRKIRKVERKVQHLKRTKMALIANIMDETKHEAVEKDVKLDGLKPPNQRPYRIVAK